jgi:hypothetical protein
MPESTEPSDDVWELVEFSAREGLLLRSFLEYLKEWPDSIDRKMQRVQHWREEMAAALSRPDVVKFGSDTIQKLRDAPPSIRKTVLQQALAHAHSQYFEPKV